MINEIGMLLAILNGAMGFLFMGVGYKLNSLTFKFLGGFFVWAGTLGVITKIAQL